MGQDKDGVKVGHVVLTVPGRMWLLVGCAISLAASSASPLGMAWAGDRRPRGVNRAFVWQVVETGLTAREGKRLAKAFGVPLSLRNDHSFRFIDPAFGQVPEVDLPAGQQMDEDGRATDASAPDFDAIRALEPVPDKKAIRMTMRMLDKAAVDVPGRHRRHVLHSELTFDLPRDPENSFTQEIDTTVRLRFSLDGTPVEGPGAGIRVTYDPAGEITELRWATRTLQRGAPVELISAGRARSRCAAHYPPGSTLGKPRLLYWAPPLSMRVRALFPHWECSGLGPSAQALVSAVIPAARGAAPKVTFQASTQGDQVQATARVTGGRRPYQYLWGSMSTTLDPEAANGKSISYRVAGRDPVLAEELWLTVIDANGLTSQVAKLLNLSAPGESFIPGPNPLQVGGEFNVYEWGCVQASSAGFRDVFTANGVPIAFRFNGTSAWERDFKQADSPTNGDDANYVDDVDLAWYTGHGGPGSFTFDNPNKDDDSIVPADARYGDRDLEWLQLESCNVLQSPDGNGITATERWGGVFDGLHLLNGFHTTASCVDNTAGTFASYLFSGLTVRQAWAQMASDLEPAGKVYVSMGPVRIGDYAWNFSDHFWGQGSVGPDIRAAQTIGLWSLSGTV